MNSSLRIREATKASMNERASIARQTVIVFLFTNGGDLMGIYQSARMGRGSPTWSITQGEIEQDDMLKHYHPAVVAAKRELYEELHVDLAYDTFEYVSSALDCINKRRSPDDPRKFADYHMVFGYTKLRHVVPKLGEVREFKWIDVGGCLESLKPRSGFMSKQKSAIVETGLGLMALRGGDPKKHPKLAKHIGQTRWARTARAEPKEQLAA